MATPNTKLTSAEEQQSREALAQMLWTGGIIGFFAVQAVVWAIAITLTYRDPSHAVIADLDERVGSWDLRRAAHVASENLGWQTVIEVTPGETGQNTKQVQLRLQDRAGNLVAAERIDVFGFHRARVTERKRLALELIEPGVWRIAEDIKRPGWWRFEGQASLGADEFTFRATEFLVL